MGETQIERLGLRDGDTVRIRLKDNLLQTVTNDPIYEPGCEYDATVCIDGRVYYPYQVNLPSGARFSLADSEVEVLYVVDRGPLPQEEAEVPEPVLREFAGSLGRMVNRAASLHRQISFCHDELTAHRRSAQDADKTVADFKEALSRLGVLSRVEEILREWEEGKAGV